MLNDPLISVIVPVYNAERYLGDCVESILRQNFSSYELILVDDESIDHSGQLCDEYASKYEHISVVHKLNDGPNAARAEGVKKARGQWVTFVDSHDTLLPTSLTDLYSGASDGTDIVVGFSFESVDPQHVVQIEDWRKALVKSDMILCTPWGKLFRRTIMRDEHFHLITNNRTGTDMPFNIKVAFATEKPVVIIHPQIYVYNKHAESVSHSAKWTVSKMANLYAEVVNSIPEDKREALMNQLIENRLLSLKRVFTDTAVKHRERNNSKSAYLIGLRSDVKTYHYPLGWLDKFALRFPDCTLTYVMFKIKLKMRIMKEFIKRKMA